MELSKQGWRNLFKIKQWISCRGRTENHLAPLHLLIITVSSQISPTHGCTQPAGQNGWRHGGTEIRCVFEIMFVKMPVKPSSVQLSSVTQSCLTLCDPMNHSTPGLPVHHQHPEFTQTHVHRVGDAIQPSHPLSSPSPPAPNPSKYQGLFQWVKSSHEVAKVLKFQLQHQSFQWTRRTDLL